MRHVLIGGLLCFGIGTPVALAGDCIASTVAGQSASERVGVVPRQASDRARPGDCPAPTRVLAAPAKSAAAAGPGSPLDNASWRFEMSQNGTRMTADEFSAWMEARGVRVAKGAPGVAAPPAPAVAPEPDKK